MASGPMAPSQHDESILSDLREAVFCKYRIEVDGVRCPCVARRGAISSRQSNIKGKKKTCMRHSLVMDTHACTHSTYGQRMNMHQWPEWMIDIIKTFCPPVIIISTRPILGCSLLAARTSPDTPYIYAELFTCTQVHDERELDRVLKIDGVELIGINNRSLGIYILPPSIKYNAPLHRSSYYILISSVFY